MNFQSLFTLLRQNECIGSESRYIIFEFDAVVAAFSCTALSIFIRLSD